MYFHIAKIEATESELELKAEKTQSLFKIANKNVQKRRSIENLAEL